MKIWESEVNRKWAEEVSTLSKAIQFLQESRLSSDTVEEAQEVVRLGTLIVEKQATLGGKFIWPAAPERPKELTFDFLHYIFILFSEFGLRQSLRRSEWSPKIKTATGNIYLAKDLLYPKIYLQKAKQELSEVLTSAGEKIRPQADGQQAP